MQIFWEHPRNMANDFTTHTQNVSNYVTYIRERISACKHVSPCIEHMCPIVLYRRCSWSASTFRVCSSSVFTACVIQLYAQSGRASCREFSRTRPPLPTSRQPDPLEVSILYIRRTATLVMCYLSTMKPGSNRFSMNVFLVLIKSLKP